MSKEKYSKKSVKAYLIISQTLVNSIKVIDLFLTNKNNISEKLNQNEYDFDVEFYTETECTYKLDILTSSLNEIVKIFDNKNYTDLSTLQKYCTSLGYSENKFNKLLKSKTKLSKNSIMKLTKDLIESILVKTLGLSDSAISEYYLTGDLTVEDLGSEDIREILNNFDMLDKIKSLKFILVNLCNIKDLTTVIITENKDNHTYRISLGNNTLETVEKYSLKNINYTLDLINSGYELHQSIVRELIHNLEILEIKIQHIPNNQNILKDILTSKKKLESLKIPALDRINLKLKDLSKNE